MSDGQTMRLWDSVCKTDLSYTKSAKIGQMNITSICAQYQRKSATNVFGSYGIGWGVDENENSYSLIEFENKTILCRYSANFWYYHDGKKGSFPITACVKVCYVTNAGKGYLLIDDEFSKKVMTNAVTKGLSFLGFNSDIFEGKFEDNQYINMLKAEQAAKNKVDMVKNDKNFIEWSNKFASSEDKKAVEAELLTNFNASDDILELIRNAKPFLLSNYKNFEVVKSKLSDGSATMELVMDHYNLLPEDKKELLKCVPNL